MGELAEKIRNQQRRLAERVLRTRASGLPRMDAVSYLSSALEAYRALDLAGQKQLLAEAAAEGQKGLAINDPRADAPAAAVPGSTYSRNSPPSRRVSAGSMNEAEHSNLLQAFFGVDSATQDVVGTGNTDDAAPQMASIGTFDAIYTTPDPSISKAAERRGGYTESNREDAA